MVDKKPGEHAIVTFDLTNTGSPVSGVGDDEFFMSIFFIHPPSGDIISGQLYSGPIKTDETLNYTGDITIYNDAIPGPYDLEIEVWYGAELVGYAKVSAAVDVIGVYSVSISNITIT